MSDLREDLEQAHNQFVSVFQHELSSLVRTLDHVVSHVDVLHDKVVELSEDNDRVTYWIDHNEIAEIKARQDEFQQSFATLSRIVSEISQKVDNLTFDWAEYRRQIINERNENAIRNS